MAIGFDFDAALKALQSGQDLSGENGMLTPLIKQLAEAALKAELEQHIDQDSGTNRKNGSTRKTIKSTFGNFELLTPRDRTGTFEPQLIKKHQTDELIPELKRVFKILCQSKRSSNALRLLEVQCRLDFLLTLTLFC